MACPTYTQSTATCVALFVLSLFDGISVGRLALERAGVRVKRYLTSEVNENAIQISKHAASVRRWKMKRLGDVRKIKAADLPEIDLLMGGSPCQGFSVAGKGGGFTDPRSALFYEFVRLLREVKPKYFLLENVLMRTEWVERITAEMGVAPVMINSALVSAQSRKRLYWTNIQGRDSSDLFGGRPIPQPDDKGIVLADILEKSSVADRTKSYAITASYSNDVKAGECAPSVFSPLQVGMVGKKPAQNSQACRVYSAAHKARVLMGEAGSGGGLTGLYVAPRKKGLSRIGTVSKRGDKVLNARGNTRGRGHFVYSPSGKAATLISSGAHRCFTELYATPADTYARTLTATECERLQTLPDGFTAAPGVSDRQRIKALGNAWTCDVIAHILSFIREDDYEKDH